MITWVVKWGVFEEVLMNDFFFRNLSSGVYAL